VPVLHNSVPLHHSTSSLYHKGKDNMFNTKIPLSEIHLAKKTYFVKYGWLFFQSDAVFQMVFEYSS